MKITWNFHLVELNPHTSNLHDMMLEHRGNVSLTFNLTFIYIFFIYLLWFKTNLTTRIKVL